MKLAPRQVRFVLPFWQGFSRRRLRFAGKRNTIHLQETALVVEGEIFRFHYLGLERFFARVFSEWTTVTVPYSRITAARCRRKTVFPLLILAMYTIMALIVIPGAYFDPRKQALAEAAGFLVLAGAASAALAAGSRWGFAPTHSVTFRARDGKLTSFLFRIRSKAVRMEFDEVLSKYRDAARAFVPPEAR
jgi:hypothetical protein